MSTLFELPFLLGKLPAGDSGMSKVSPRCLLIVKQVAASLTKSIVKSCKTLNGHNFGTVDLIYWLYFWLVGLDFLYHFLLVCGA